MRFPQWPPQPPRLHHALFAIRHHVWPVAAHSPRLPGNNCAFARMGADLVHPLHIQAGTGFPNLPADGSMRVRQGFFICSRFGAAGRTPANKPYWLKLQRVPKDASRKRNKILVTVGFLRQDGIVFPVLCSTLERRAPIVAIQTRKPIEIDLSGIEIEGIQLFVQEGAHQIPAMELGTVPPCVYPCVVPPCAACGSAPSISAAK